MPAKHMKECCGLWGRIFGHRFESFVFKSVVEPPKQNTDIWSTYQYPDLVESLTRRETESIVRCRRCGAAVEDYEKGTKAE